MTYHYIPSPFMLPTSHYDEKKADRAVTFIQNLCHTKGRWAGQKFLLLPWQEQIVRDLFGIVKEDGNRQFLTAYVEIPKKNGKSELAAAIALYLLYADGEASAEVYGAACDRNQASIVFDVAKQMVLMSRALEKRSKVMGATKRIINYSNAGFYQVLSAETGTKHGLNVSGLVFDEIHAQPNRHLYDVLTKGSGDAREQPLFFIITTAGNDKNSICYELHTKALDILKGRKKDNTFYPVVYGLSEEEDWNDEENWLKANPSLGHTIGIDRVREAYLNALDNPAEENVFKQLRLNIWTNSAVTWIPEHIYDKGSQPIDVESLKGRTCYAGLDLSSTSDITAFVLIFPPKNEAENYQVLPFFWLPEDTLVLRSRRDHVLYDVWEKQGFLLTTEGNVVHYGFIEQFIEELSTIYHIKEIAYDRWNATQMVQNLEGMGLTMVPFGQGYKDMSPPSKEFYKLMMEGKIQHGGHPVLKWMAQNVVMRQDPAGNIKPDKEKSVEKIDGIVAIIMALDCYPGYSHETGKNFIHKLSFELSKNGYRIVNGYGKGVGEFILNGVADYCLNHNSKISDFLTLMPFPQNSSLGIDLDKLYKENREQLIDNCGTAIFIFGNKETENIASGVIDEFELCKKHGLVCLPIEHTGGSAKEIFNKITLEITDKNTISAIKQANKQCDGDIDMSVKNIVQAVKILNKEEL